MRRSVCPLLAVPLALSLVTSCNRGASSGETASSDEDDLEAQLEHEHEHEPAHEPEGEPADAGAEDVLAAEMQAYAAAEPVFERHCARCHVPGGADASRQTLHHFSMESYPFGGHHAHELTDTIREVLGAGDGEPTMPEDEPGALSDEELELALAWAEAFDRAEAAGVGHHAGGGDDAHDHGHSHDHDH